MIQNPKTKIQNESISMKEVERGEIWRTFLGSWILDLGLRL
jgi:hypothetical protein